MKKASSKGFTLVEVLVSLAILSALTVGVYSLIIFSLKIAAMNANLVEATAIANQEMEKVRNMPYNSIGITSGIPQGLLPEYKTVVRSNTFTVHFYVKFFDDPFDGIEEFGTDTLGQDYKIVTLDVSWPSTYGEKTITFFTKVIPRTEEMSVGGGLLKIYASDSNGNPVPAANIHVVNNALSPAINFNDFTNSNGLLSLPGAPAAYESYEITVTKSGYSTDQTYVRTAILKQPVRPHLSVNEGMKTEESFSIDKLSTLKIQAVAQNYPANQQLNTDTSGENQLNPKTVLDTSGNKYVVWQDYRQSSKSKIYAQKYNSANIAQWLPDDIVISPANNQIFPDVSIDSSGNLYVAWNDDSNGNQDGYIDKRSSADGSALWGTTKINTLQDPIDQTNVRFSLINTASGSDSFVLWQDERNSDMDIFMIKYDHDRTPKWANEIIVNSNTVGDGTAQYEACIKTMSNTKIITAWTDERNVDPDIYSQLFDANGNKLWANDIKINTDAGATKQTSPDMDIDASGNAYIVWTDERNGNQDIYAQKYDATGTPLWANDIRINTDASTTKQYYPAITLDNSNDLYIVWVDERNGNQDIYAQKYDNAGNALWSGDLRVSIDSGINIQSKPDVHINPATNLPFAVWHDNRNGDFDIYGVEFLPEPVLQNLNETVPINITGSKLIYTDPLTYKWNNNFNTDSNGYIELPIEWDSSGYTISLVAASTSRKLIMANPTQPFSLLADSIQNILLYLE